MIILFEENETEFTSLGLGTLKDASGCNVKESLNDTYDLQMEYPIDGHNFSKLIEGRIIYCKPNPYDEAQPFRIRSITKPIKGVVTVYADHISYDMVGIPVKAISGNNVNDTLDKVSKESIVSNNFKFKNHIESSRTFKTTGPYNMRQLLMDGDESIIGVYEGEVKFNGFLIELFKQRGKDRGAKVVYGKNMTDLSHESNSEKLYNGLYPYYHQEKTENNTIDNKEFTKGYIVGSKPFMAGWLSFSENGEPYQPTSETPIQIATEGEYFDKVYAWSERNQKYIEKIYNEQFTIMQGLVEPSWITIDWSKFPVIAARAAKNGYFKKATDQDWGEFKAVGDIIFEGSIVNSGITESLILYFSEVIPDNGSTENQSVSEVVLVELDDPIIPIETQWTKNMKRKRVLSVNFASEFDEEPTKDQLKQKAEEYIKKNKIGEIKHTTTVSFVDLASTTEKDKYQNFDHIELGDNVRVIYEDLGVDVNLRVISTEYDVISEKYTNIELGEKEDKFSSTTVQTGDGVSSLSNDADYTDATRVKKLIADTVTAEYLEATNAKLGEAAIKQLEVQRINIKGILEASQFSIDELVAKMLTSENAKISNELQAGTVKIDGNITARTGNIGGFTIDENSLTNGTIGEDNSVVMCTGSNTYAIIAGSEKINNWVFTAGKNFGVTKEGKLYANNAILSGTIKATDGEIGGFTIDRNSLSIGKLGEKDSVVVSTGTEGYAAIAGSENQNNWVFTASDKFGVTKDGDVYAKDAYLRGHVFTEDGSIGGFTVQDGMILSEGQTSNVEISPEYMLLESKNSNAPKTNKSFLVTKDGHLEANDVDITGIVNAEQIRIDGIRIKSTNTKKISGFKDIIFHVEPNFYEHNNTVSCTLNVVAKDENGNIINVPNDVNIKILVTFIFKQYYGSTYLNITDTVTVNTIILNGSSSTTGSCNSKYTTSQHMLFTDHSIDYYPKSLINNVGDLVIENGHFLDKDYCISKDYFLYFDDFGTSNSNPQAKYKTFGFSSIFKSSVPGQGAINRALILQTYLNSLLSDDFKILKSITSELIPNDLVTLTNEQSGPGTYNEYYKHCKVFITDQYGDEWGPNGLNLETSSHLLLIILQDEKIKFQYPGWSAKYDVGLEGEILSYRQENGGQKKFKGVCIHAYGQPKEN